MAWELGLYDTGTGAFKESATDYRTEKFELQNCVYDFQMGNGNIWPGIYIWNENGEYVGGYENNADVGKFVAKAGWKYAIKVNGDASAVSLLPVDNRANVSGISTVTVDGNSAEWVAGTYGSEADISAPMVSAGFAASATANEIQTRINKCSHAAFLVDSTAINFVATGVEPVMWVRAWEGRYLLFVLDVAAADAPALVGTVTIN